MRKLKVDQLISADVFDSRLTQVEQYFDVQMDMKMAQLEGEITKKFTGLEKQCSRQIFARLSRNDFETSISAFRADIRDMYTKVQFVQQFSNFLKDKLE